MKRPSELSSHGEFQPTNNLKDLKSSFISAALTMSWQLAIAFLVPVIGGVEIDHHFKTSPVWTIVGFVVAIAAVVMIIKNLLREFSPSPTKPKTEKK